MIKCIRIEGYKSFRNLSLELKPLTVILGPNASGKSNFLDALYFISRAVTKKNLKEAFEGHRGLPIESFHYGNEGYEELLKKSSLKFTIEVDLEISPLVKKKVKEIVQAKRKGIDSSMLKEKIITEPLLRYRLITEVLPETRYIRVFDERLCTIKRNGKEKKRRPFLEREGNSLHLRMEGHAHPIFHEIGLDHTIVSTALYEPHYPHITAFRMELANWCTYYLEPKVMMKEEIPIAEIECPGPRGENLAAFLKTLEHKYPKDYKNLNLSLKRILSTDAGIEVEHLKDGSVGLRISENGLRFSARQISEGTLRLIGILCAAHPRNPATTIAFEEPENGIHPTRLKNISDLLKNAVEAHEKQIIVTTHSPTLSEYFENENLFVCEKKGKQTMIKPFSSSGDIFRGQEIVRSLE